MKTSEPPVTVEQDLNASKDSVWKALTDPAEMKKWFFPQIEEFKPKVGFVTEFDVDAGERVFRHCWEIKEVIPGKKLALGWRYAGYPGDSTVTFELFENNAGTTLILTHEVLKDFPDDIPEFQRDSCLEGWRYFIQKGLREYFEGPVS